MVMPYTNHPLIPDLLYSQNTTCREITRVQSGYLAKLIYDRPNRWVINSPSEKSRTTWIQVHYLAWITGVYRRIVVQFVGRPISHNSFCRSIYAVNSNWANGYCSKPRELRKKLATPLISKTPHMVNMMFGKLLKRHDSLSDRCRRFSTKLEKS